MGGRGTGPSALRVEYPEAAERPRDGPRRPRRKLLLVTLAVIVGVLLLFPSPVVVVNPVPTMDLAGSFYIEGAGPPNRGQWLATAVTVEQPNMLGLGMALARGRQVIFATGFEDPYEVYFAGLADHEHSRALAAVAGAQAVGLPASVRGTGAEVVRVDPNGPAAGLLQSGDVIEAVDGEPVRMVTDAVAAITSRPSGSSLQLLVRRGEQFFELAVASSENDPDELPRLGVELVTADFSVELPFTIRFERDPEVIGPSAGLAYALAIADALDPDDLTGGRGVAASGHLDSSGGVHAVGGLGAKAVAAAGDGATLFFVPKSIQDEAAGKGVTVYGVSSVAEAIEILRSLGDE